MFAVTQALHGRAIRWHYKNQQYSAASILSSSKNLRVTYLGFADLAGVTSFPQFPFSLERSLLQRTLELHCRRMWLAKRLLHLLTLFLHQNIVLVWLRK
jgi:hypothetical protein